MLMGVFVTNSLDYQTRAYRVLYVGAISDLSSLRSKCAPLHLGSKVPNSQRGVTDYLPCVALKDDAVAPKSERRGIDAEQGGDDVTRTYRMWFSASMKGCIRSKSLARLYIDLDFTRISR